MSKQKKSTADGNKFVNFIGIVNFSFPIKVSLHCNLFRSLPTPVWEVNGSSDQVHHSLHCPSLATRLGIIKSEFNVFVFWILTKQQRNARNKIGDGGFVFIVQPEEITGPRWDTWTQPESLVSLSLLSYPVLYRREDETVIKNFVYYDQHGTPK